MSSRRRGRPRFSIVDLAGHLVQVLVRNTVFAKIFIIPGLLFFLDFTLRVCFDADLIDAGADMALLGVGTFVALLIENMEHQQHTAIVTVFILISLILWIICLRIASLHDPIRFGFLLWLLDFRLVLSWLIGVLAFVFSGIMTNVVVESSGTGG